MAESGQVISVMSSYIRELQRMLSYVRRAVDDYGMIEEGDRIAVGVSGGKDSLTLLEGLSELRRSLISAAPLWLSAQKFFVWHSVIGQPFNSPAHFRPLLGSAPQAVMRT